VAPSPDPLHELVAGHDLPGAQAERVQQLELGRREPDRHAVDVRLDVARVDQQFLEMQRHRERLHEVVVGAELESANAVVLCAAGADDDDRRSDPFAADCLDDAPAVDARQHQVEHTDVRLAVAKCRQAGLALVDDGWLEAGHGEMLRHAAADYSVVFDDENAGHDEPPAIIETRCSERGTGPVREW
jgi:hypothetical protein